MNKNKLPVFTLGSIYSTKASGAGKKYMKQMIEINRLRLLQTFAGVLQKKIRTRAVFKETPTNYISKERL